MFVLSLQLVILFLGVKTSINSRNNIGGSIFPKSIKIYLSTSISIMSIFILYNIGEEKFLGYSIIISIAVVLSTIGDMLIFHVFKLKKSTIYGVYCIVVANFTFGYAFINLFKITSKDALIIGITCIIGCLILYIIKKIILRKVYTWVLIFGEGLIFMNICAVFMVINVGVYGIVPFIGAILALLSGILVLLRSFFNTRFKNMSIFVWTLYVVSLIALAYSPLIMINI
ncbi:lysoplasmalogenase family protein [Oceanirhabdus sp. W0125-5]|uniref:lysoplasmalogenase family protein n=1 Tax=Oceanirhabdus sp. W0125-5 TaxID=2999116 RepID=UPI0022F2CAAC|nr:lysoplasmalogenase family protein [Oceanirhabdus sp. W0125-5]WBW97893.1 lysoplasmalogenase family protein [Oceanirhabdus sp. W0125-5]